MYHEEVLHRYSRQGRPLIQTLEETIVAAVFLEQIYRNKFIKIDELRTSHLINLFILMAYMTMVFTLDKYWNPNRCLLHQTTHLEFLLQNKVLQEEDFFQYQEI